MIMKFNTFKNKLHHGKNINKKFTNPLSMKKDQKLINYIEFSFVFLFYLIIMFLAINGSAFPIRNEFRLPKL